MNNPELRRIAEEDWSRAVAAGQREDAKTAAIVAGSVVEAIALDILERLSADDVVRLRDHLNSLAPGERRDLAAERQRRPEEWRFAFLLVAIGPRGLKVLTEQTHEIGHQLRDWRNYVHPAVERTQPRLGPADGRLGLAFAEKVMEEAVAWSADGGRLIIPS
jgi:hypothetical protein